MSKQENKSQALRKKRRPMSEIYKDIDANNRKKPTRKEVEELFEILYDEGHAVPLDKAAKPKDPEPNP